MGKRKEERYRFYPSTQIIKIPDNVKQHDILLVTNSEDGIIIANQFDPGKGFICTLSPGGQQHMGLLGSKTIHWR